MIIINPTYFVCNPGFPSQSTEDARGSWTPWRRISDKVLTFHPLSPFIHPLFPFIHPFSFPSTPSPSIHFFPLSPSTPSAFQLCQFFQSIHLTLPPPLLPTHIHLLRHIFCCHIQLLLWSQSFKCSCHSHQYFPPSISSSSISGITFKFQGVPSLARDALPKPEVFFHGHDPDGIFMMTRIMSVATILMVLILRRLRGLRYWTGLTDCQRGEFTAWVNHSFLICWDSLFWTLLYVYNLNPQYPI